LKIELVFNIDNDQFATEEPHLFNSSAVASAIIGISGRINDRPYLRQGDSAYIFDVNGNRIGMWRIATDTPARPIEVTK